MIYIVLIFILGLIFGSFFACMGYRIPNKVSTIKPNSFCPKCKNELKWYMNIPVFSYIFLKGKCAFCKEKIDIIYPLTELFTAISFTIAYLIYGFSSDYLIALTLLSVFIITLITDLKYYYISDRILVIGTLLILLISIIFNDIDVFKYKLLNGIIMFSIMYLIKIIGDRAFNRESLGGGDIKLMFLIGVTIKFIPSVMAMFIASILGIIYSYFKQNEEGIIPFGPFLLLATIIMWYLNINASILNVL